MKIWIFDNSFLTKGAKGDVPKICGFQITCHTSLWYLSRIATKKPRSTANFFNSIQNCADHFIFLDSNTHFQYFILGKLNELCRGICVVIQTTMLTDSRLLAISTGASIAFYLDLILDKIWIKVGESWKNNFIRLSELNPDFIQIFLKIQIKSG